MTLGKIARGLVLPREISTFEREYLRRMNRIGLIFFLLHVPVMALFAWANGTGTLLALALMCGVVAGPAIAYKTLQNPRAISTVYGVTAMFVGGVLVHVGQGPVQIEMHFYFFALIAMLAVFGNPLVILAAAGTVALHHLALWFVLPKSVFNYDAPVWVVAVHAAFVVLESIASCFIARSFFDNVIGLEKIVAQRTAELDQRNHEMRMVLDNIGQGLVVIDQDGTLSHERSRMLATWFGEGETIFDLFERASPTFAECSRLALSQMSDGFLPVELVLEQMPRDLAHGDRRYDVVYRAIEGGKLLCVVTDVTAQKNEERAEEERREAMVLFEKVLADRSVVGDFVEEGGLLVETIAQDSTELKTTQRLLHTLKGNSAIFGLHGLSRLCHDLESYVIEERSRPTDEHLAMLRERWGTVQASMDRWLGARRNILEVEIAQYQALEAAVLGTTPRPALVAMVRDLELESSERRLQHFADQARRIAARLGKSVTVSVESGGLRIDPKYWTSFWSVFIHAVRNAVDHGIDSEGHITLALESTKDAFEVSISDDGRGIDWSAIAKRAGDLGLPSETREDLLDALFHDGVSTAERITDISGRGLGMGALREVARSMAGDVRIESELGKGTSVRIALPHRVALARAS